MNALAAGLLREARRRPARLGRTRLVVIDGPAGSGKTTLAERLCDAACRGGEGEPALSCAVVHLEDLYEGWAGLEDSWERLHRHVLVPLAAGTPARFPRYDWYSGRFDGGAVNVPVVDLLVVEGVGAARLAADPVASLRIWVEAAPEVRLARGLARDGEHLRAQWQSWMADEAAHFAREGTRDRCDVRLRTDQPEPDQLDQPDQPRPAPTSVPKP